MPGNGPAQAILDADLRHPPRLVRRPHEIGGMAEVVPRPVGDVADRVLVRHMRRGWHEPTQTTAGGTDDCDVAAPGAAADHAASSGGPRPSRRWTSSFPATARRSVHEEAWACTARDFDRAQVIDAEIARYRAEGLPEASGLIEAPILLRRHTPVVSRLNAAWWMELACSRRDRLGFRQATSPLSLAVRNGLIVKFKR